MIDIDLYLDILSRESTSGKERDLALYLADRLPVGDCKVETFEVGDGTLNLLLSWGEPKVVFCSHLDTVPPFIAPTQETLQDGDILFKGRGTCDAKGQIISLYAACLELQKRGCRDFGLLLLSGEETGSFGAKAFRTAHRGGDVVIVGEPTDGKVVTASKGTKSFQLHFKGQSAHSGYPHRGHSAVEDFVDFVQNLRNHEFPVDPLLGQTTYNIGKLISDNPQNILSDSLDCRVYFRTTFSSDAHVQEYMCSLASDTLEVEARGGDTPLHYTAPQGFPTCTVAFGSDAPQLSNFERKLLVGPGSILVAHRSEECVRLSELEEAAKQYVDLYFALLK